MKKLLSILLVLVMLLPMLPVLAADETPMGTPFEDGDVVALFGSSSTQNSLWERYLHMYYATHLPDVSFETVNFGHAGDDTQTLLNKLDRDLAYRPDITKACVLIGANDTNAEKSPLFEERLTAVVKKLQSQPKIKEVILMTISRYDGSGPSVQFSLDNAEITRKVAKAMGCPLADSGRMLVEFDDKLEVEKPGTTIFPDKLHADSTGHMYYAYAILNAQGLVPANGKDLPIVTVDTTTNTVTEAKNATASEVTQNGDSWSVTITADRLPFPIMGGYELAEEIGNFDDLIGMHDLYQFTGLGAGMYTLSVDGTEVGTYSHNQLCAGVDLANIDGSPVQERAKLVRRKVEMLMSKSTGYMSSGHVVEYSDLGIEKVNPTLEEITEAVNAKVAAGEMAQNTANAMINNKKNRETLYQEMRNLYAEVKELANNRTFTFTVTKKTGAGTPNKSFADVENHWGKTFILPMAQIGIINGKGEGVFDPDGTVTRAEFLTLALKVGKITATAGDSYSDVDAGAWFAATVATAKEQGLIPDAMVADGKFYPDKPITREEMTAVLTALYESQKPALKEAEVGHFTDRANFSSWAVAPIAKAVGLGLVAGNPDGSFNALGNATRAEAAVIMNRLYKQL